MRRLYYIFISIIISTFADLSSEGNVSQSKYIWLGRVNSSALLIRSEPNINGKILGKILNGHIISVILETENVDFINGIRAPWYKIKTPSGILGYVFGGYVDKPENNKRFNLDGKSNIDTSSMSFKSKCKDKKCIENYILEKLKEKANRDGEVITLRCTNNQTISYKNMNNNIGTSVNYYLADYYPEEGFYLILISYYEGRGFALIKENNCANVTIVGKPIFSPDKNRFICFENGGFGYPSWNKLEIFRLEENGFQNEFTLSPGWGPSEVVWEGNSKIIIMTNYYDFYKEKKFSGVRDLYFKAEIELVNNKWLLTE